MAFIRGVLRNAPWLVIAIVVHVVAIAALSIIYVKATSNEVKIDPTAVTINTDQKPEEKPPEPEEEKILDRNAIPKPSADKEQEIVPGDLDIPTDTGAVTDSSEDLSKEAGAPGAIDDSPTSPGGGTAIGVGAGPGRRGTGPTPFSSRKQGTGQGGGRQIKGAKIETERAVSDGINWLLRHQQPDGSWAADKMKDTCKPAGHCTPEDKDHEVTAIFNEGLTGMALLAFLGHGFDHTFTKTTIVDTVRAKRHNVGEVIKNGLKWLVERQKSQKIKDGRFSESGYMYNEALATLAMCEAYGMTGHKAWKDSAQSGLDYLVKAQRLNPQGTGLWGWRYDPRSYMESEEGKAKALAAGVTEKDWLAQRHEADISITAWVIMALKSGELAGLTVPHESMEGGLAFTHWVTFKKDGKPGQEDGRVAYMRPVDVDRPINDGTIHNFVFHGTTLAALGMCVRTFVEKNIDDPVLEKSAERIVKDLPAVSKDKMSVDYYYWYYGTLALNQFDGPDSPRQGGKYWKPWNRALTDAILPLQQAEAKTCSHGSWPTPDRWSAEGGAIYRTAINVLTLEVYYRYENAFGAAAALRKKSEDLKKDALKKEDEKLKESPK